MNFCHVHKFSDFLNKNENEKVQKKLNFSNVHFFKKIEHEKSSIKIEHLDVHFCSLDVQIEITMRAVGFQAKSSEIKQNQAFRVNSFGL